jgi:hypothetical protein
MKFAGRRGLGDVDFKSQARPGLPTYGRPWCGLSPYCLKVHPIEGRVTAGCFAMHILFRARRPDPDWDLDGRAARHGRRRRRFLGSIVVLLSAVILALILASLPSVDATALVAGPSRPVMLTSLGGDAVACCLIFARESQRRRAIRRYGELPVIHA